MKVKVSVGVVFISIKDFTITKGIGRGYNVASVSTMDDGCVVGEELQIIIDGVKDRFIIYSIAYGKNKDITITAKGLPSILENEVYGITSKISYNNSDELIEDSRGSIAVINNLPLIDFKGLVYVKQNTPISRILDMVAVVNGDAYEYADVLHLEPFKTIADGDTAIDVDEIVYDYNYMNILGKYTNVGSVYINHETDDVYSETNITLQQINNTFNLLFNPSLNSNIPYLVDGITIDNTPRNLLKTETYSVVDTFYVKTIGGIDTVNSILLNGEPFIDYSLNTPTNIIEFNYNISGTLEITYKTKGLYGEVFTSVNYSIKYACKILSDYFNVTTTVDNPNCIATLLEGVGVNSGASFNFSKGKDFTFIFAENNRGSTVDTLATHDLNGGGKLTIKYRYDTRLTLPFIGYISNTASSTIISKTDTVYYDDVLGEYIISVNENMSSINSVHYGSLEVVSYINNGTYLSFDSSYLDKTLEVSYNIDVVKVVIPPLQISGLQFLDVIGCNGITSYPIGTSDVANDDMMCKLPSRFDVDIAGSFGLSIANVSGKVITSSGLGNFTVDGRGKITVELHSQNTYVLNCDTIIPSAEVYIDSQGVAYA